MDVRVTVDGLVFNFNLAEVTPGVYQGVLREDSKVRFRLVGPPNAPTARVMASVTEAVISVVTKTLEVTCVSEGTDGRQLGA